VAGENFYGFPVQPDNVERPDTWAEGDAVRRRVEPEPKDIDLKECITMLLVGLMFGIALCVWLWA